MREQLYESIRSDVLPEARGLVTEMLEAGTRLKGAAFGKGGTCLLYTSPSPRDSWACRMPSSACKKKNNNNED